MCRLIMMALAGDGLAAVEGWLSMADELSTDDIMPVCNQGVTHRKPSKFKMLKPTYADDFPEWVVFISHPHREDERWAAILVWNIYSSLSLPQADDDL